MDLLDLDGAPWVDRPSFDDDADRLVAAGQLTPERRRQLETWRRHGYLVLRGAIPPDLVTEVREAYERAWSERPPCDANVKGLGVIPLRDAPIRAEIGHTHYRLLGFHEHSDGVRRAIFHDSIVDVISSIFDAPPVAMQTLMIEYGSQQGFHQDFPYVTAQQLPCMLASWIALEDVDDDNGPVEYFRGSHRVPCFEWGDDRSLVYDNGDPELVDEFARYLSDQCTQMGLERETFHARAGDVLLWHAGLAHAGSPIRDPSRTRLSLVTHYSTREGYPHDRRFPDVEPVVRSCNGGSWYQRPPAPEIGGSGARAGDQTHSRRLRRRWFRTR